MGRRQLPRARHRGRPGPPGGGAASGDPVKGLAVRRYTDDDEPATDPAYQGRGIFSGLTLHAIDELTREGLHFIFNTPNDQSLPGYLKMGWQIVGKLPVSARPRAPATVARMARARTAADLWSTPTDAGLDAVEVLADTAGLGALLVSQPRTDG